MKVASTASGGFVPSTFLQNWEAVYVFQSQSKFPFIGNSKRDQNAGTKQNQGKIAK